jgi:hypothetical protein
MVMNRRTLFISAISAALLPDIARAGAPLTFVPQPGLVGSGRLNILTVPVLDVSLFAPLSHWRPDRPYALQVTFLRDLEARRMAGHIRDEMRHIGVEDGPRLNLWTERLKSVLPDMKRNEVLTGVHDESGTVLFFRNDKGVGRVSESGFSDAFFGICLGPRTSQPKLREANLGLS